MHSFGKCARKGSPRTSRFLVFLFYCKNSKNMKPIALSGHSRSLTQVGRVIGTGAALPHHRTTQQLLSPYPLSVCYWCLYRAPYSTFFSSSFQRARYIYFTCLFPSCHYYFAWSCPLAFCNLRSSTTSKEICSSRCRKTLCHRYGTRTTGKGLDHMRVRCCFSYKKNLIFCSYYDCSAPPTHRRLFAVSQ